MTSLYKTASSCFASMATILLLLTFLSLTPSAASAFFQDDPGQPSQIIMTNGGVETFPACRVCNGQCDAGNYPLCGTNTHCDNCDCSCGSFSAGEYEQPYGFCACY